MRKYFVALVLGPTTLGLPGCSLKTIALRQTAALMEGGVGAFHDESDVQLAREAMAAQLKIADAMLRNEPANSKLRLLASQGYSGYAFLFLEGSQDARAREFYGRGRDHAKTLLLKNPALKNLEAMNQEDFHDALTRVTVKDSRALFWAAYGWGSWINLSRDSAEAVAQLPRAVAMMERARGLAPSYQFAGADIFLGCYYASRPKLLGGDPKQARAHFEKARTITQGQYLMSYVLEARYLAVALQDQELFTQLLTRVMQEPAGRLAGSRLADEVAKEKAKALLEKTDEFF